MSGKKLNRKYRMLIELENGKILEITDPLTLEFNIERNTAVSLNKGIFRIYNLGLNIRNQIFQDRFRVKDFGSGKLYKKLILQAGYNQLSTIFVGNILESYSFRQGANVIQYIECYDGLYGAVNGFVSQTLNKGASVNEALELLVNQLPNVDKGTIASQEGTLSRGRPFFGNTYTVLDETFRNKVYIDLEQLNLLDPNQAITGQLPLIKSETGLLSTPRRQQSYLQVDIVFEPRLTLGQLVAIESSINPIFDGQFKIFGITHQGTISGAISGEAKTTLQLFIGSEVLGGLKTITKKDKL
jgi:hypothetical protein